MTITLNKDKKIGEVLYIVEGEKTEPFILHKIFTRIFDYQFEIQKRNDKDRHCYNSKENPNSKAFVINTEESNIKFIDDSNAFLNNLFSTLMYDYDFDVDNAAIYYLFDRDDKSNKDSLLVETLLHKLTNALDNPDYDRQGLLLLSYPSIESFTLSNFSEDTLNLQFDTGCELKTYLQNQKLNQSRISEETLCHAMNELLDSIDRINGGVYNLDDFEQCNMDVFHYEEQMRKEQKLYHALSMIGFSLLDLGLIQIS